MSEKKTAKKTAYPEVLQASKRHADSENPGSAAFDDDTVEDELDIDVDGRSEFDNEADDEAPSVDVSELDIGDEDEDELVAEEETQSVELDESTQRYAYESEIFGKKELSTSREKLELLREERALREMLGDSF